MKKLLIVSPHFPPVNAPDMMRVVASLKHLPARGWEPTVLAVEPGDVAAPRDDGLLDRLPPGLRIERCRALPLWLTRPIGMRTLARRARGGLGRAGSRLIREIRPDLVLFSTTQFEVVTLGPGWLRDFRVPYVVDLQDPWVTGYYSRPGAPRPPGGWKYRVAQRRAARFEPAAFEPAAGFVSVSPRYLTDLAARYPWFSAKRQTTIPFGVDVDAFAAARASLPAFERRKGLLHLVGVGAVGPIMQSAVEALCAQLGAYRAAEPGAAARIRIHFVGTSYAPPRLAVPSVKPVADAFGVGDLVTESTDRVRWNTAQATMRAADGIVVLTSDDPSYTPSKIAGCFLADRPVLLVAAAGSGAARLADEIGLGTRIDPAAPSQTGFADFIRDLTSETPRWRDLRRPGVFEARHTAAARTAELAAFLDDVLGSPGAPREAT